MELLATVSVTKEEWEAIQASFSIDLREDFEGYDEETINKYDFRVGTCPISFEFDFEDGTRIGCGWYIEEFGGYIEWGDFEDYSTLSTDYELSEETSFEQDNGNKYICRFVIEK